MDASWMRYGRSLMFIDAHGRVKEASRRVHGAHGRVHVASIAAYRRTLEAMDASWMRLGRSRIAPGRSWGRSWATRGRSWALEGVP